MKQAIESDSSLALFKYYEIVWGHCGVRCLPGSLARQMRLVPPPLVWFLCLPFGFPSPPVIPEHVSDNGHRSGKWTSGAPFQRLTHTHTHTHTHTLQRSHLPFQRAYSQVVCVCVCVMIFAVMRGEARDH